MNFIEEIIAKDLEEKSVSSIVTRIPPEPNGYLHIGHAKSIYINYYMTAKQNGGKCYLRFDDTNPEKENDEYVNAIIRDVKWLGWDGDITYASDYFDKTYECAVSIIKNGLAYIDDTPPSQMAAMRGTLTTKGVNSPCRDRSIEENLQLFADMRDGKYADGTLVLRAKIDMASPNINMRDPVIYKIMHTPHYRQGSKWCIYPLYDFAHPIQDLIEGVTHSLCSIEFENHRPLYDWVVENVMSFFTVRSKQREFARLNIERTIMSKRYLKKLVDEQLVDGWDDPRMPTLCGLRRRGYTPSAIMRFIEEAGISKENSEVSPAQMEACIRDELNQTAERVMAVLEPIELKITNRPDDWCEDMIIEPLHEGDDSRVVTMSNVVYIEAGDFSFNPPPKYKRMTVGAKIRLKSAYIVTCTGTEEVDGKTRVLCEIIENTKSGSQTDVKAKGVIHWVDSRNCVPVQINLYDHLLLPVVDGDDDFANRMNPDSKISYNGFGEMYLQELGVGKACQFMRTGYFVRDTKNENVFNRTVSLKESYKPKK